MVKEFWSIFPFVKYCVNCKIIFPMLSQKVCPTCNTFLLPSKTLQKINKIRFAIVDSNNEIRSSIWDLVIKSNSLYLFPRVLGNKFKLSIHFLLNSKDGKNVQIGFTREFRMKKQDQIRPIRWRVDLLYKWFSIVSLYFPTNFLKKKIPCKHVKKPGKILLPIAPQEKAIKVELILSKGNIENFTKELISKRIFPLFFAELERTERVKKYTVIFALSIIDFPSQTLLRFFNKEIPLWLLSSYEERKNFKNLHMILYTHPEDNKIFEMVEVNKVNLTLVENRDVHIFQLAD